MTLPIAEGAVGASIPLLILSKGEVSVYALSWARHLALENNAGPVHVEKAISAVGRMYDYYTIHEKGRPIAEDDLTRLVKKFMEAREHGISELRWKPVLRKTAIDDARYFTDFSQFCADNFGHTPANPIEQKLVTSLNVREQQTYYSAMSHRRSWDKLAHLTPATGKGKGLVAMPKFRPVVGTRPGRHPKYFPPRKVLTFIRKLRSTRDKLYFLLLFFGGLRESEPLHIFVTDISFNKEDGTAKVKLAHPQMASYDWGDEFRGTQRGTREAFLKDRYGLGPRNKLSNRDPLWCGWKGIQFDSAYEATVNWLIPSMGRYFWRLHQQYMRETRAHVEDTHPYYFVNERDRYFGTPAKLSNMIGAFERTAVRIGLALSEDGVNPHGARHFYGYFCASELGLSLEVTQALMHHESALSTNIYFFLKTDVAYKHLKAACAKLATEIPLFAEVETLSLLDA